MGAGACSAMGRVGMGRIAITVLPPMVTGSLRLRDGSPGPLICGLRLTATSATGLPLMGRRGRIGRGMTL